MRTAIVIFAAAAACSGMILAGCCHAEYTLRRAPDDVPAPEGGRVVVTGSARNSGYYLFNCWALYAGNCLRPNTGDYRSFRDNVRPDRNAQMLLTAMRRHYGADQLVHTEHQEQSWGYFSLWLVWRRTIVTTAVGVRLERPEKDDSDSEQSGQ